MRGSLVLAPLKVFISYAHNDDLPALDDKRRPGFVSRLWLCLEYHFKNQGPPTPDIWRDDTGIRASDDFDEVLRGAIKDSDLLVVVLSNNWLSRPYCNKELELFAARWGDQAKSRIVVVKKSPISEADMPAMLQTKQHTVFYDEDERGPRRHREFFDYTSGSPFEEFKRQYHDAVERLAEDLLRHAREHAQQKTAAPAVSLLIDSSRKIFIAKPAGDMREPYERIVIELEKRGYRVTPAPNEKIPLESVAAATTFINEALEHAEASVHLLGRNMGNAPDGDDPEPIAKLQLRLAAARAARAKADELFLRFIWALKLVPGAGVEAQDARERDPFDVLQRFGETRVAGGEKVLDAECSAFIETFLGYLDRRPIPEVDQASGIKADSTVYLHCRRDDIDYALRIADALEKRHVKAVKPTFSADSGTELMENNKRKLAGCDAVVLCWGNVPETWIEQQPGIWRDYRKLGREKDFERKSLLAGPPEDDPDKQWAASRQSYDGVDFVLDLRQFGDGPVPPEALDALFATPPTKRTA